MLKYLNRKNNHDLLHQFQWIHPLQKTKLIEISLNTTNNNLIRQSKLINPLYFYTMLVANLKPKIKKSKNSIAAFKIRPDMAIGTTNHLHKTYLENFYMSFITSQLPILNYKTKPKFDKNNKIYNIMLSYGIKDINIMSTYNMNNNFLGGAHVQWFIKSPVKKVPFYYFSIKKVS